MTRFLFWLMVLPLAVLMALFGIKNSQIASLNLDPFPYTLEFPLFALVLGAVLVGVMVGGTSTRLSQGRWRRKARSEDQRLWLDTVPEGRDRWWLASCTKTRQ